MALGRHPHFRLYIQLGEVVLFCSDIAVIIAPIIAIAMHVAVTAVAVEESTRR